MKLNRIHLEKYTNLNESTIDEILVALSLRDQVMEEIKMAKTPAAALALIHERKRGKEAKEKLDKLEPKLDPVQEFVTSELKQHPKSGHINVLYVESKLEQILSGKTK